MMRDCMGRKPWHDRAVAVRHAKRGAASAGFANAVLMLKINQAFCCVFLECAKKNARRGREAAAADRVNGTKPLLPIDLIVSRRFS